MRYITELSHGKGKTVAVDDTILVRGVLASGGSHMLYNFVPPFDAEAVTRLNNAGFIISGKTNVGEFGLDVLGETSYYGVCRDEHGALCYPAADAIASGSADYALCVDLDGAPRRGAALKELVFIKPTYGTVSRYGVIPCACSGEQIGVMARTSAAAAELLSVIAGHDDKDGTSLRTESYKYDTDPEITGMRFGVCAGLSESADDKVKSLIDRFSSAVISERASCTAFSEPALKLSQPAWRILLSGETCNNLSRYDGVKFGYRTENYSNIEELYTRSRTESMTLLTKNTILYGSDVLSKGRYEECYDKSLRIRRYLRGVADELFSRYDLLLMPACGKTSFTVEELGDSIDAVYGESLFTSFASILGLPAITVGGIQLVADCLKEDLLFKAAAAYERAEMI